MAEAPKNARHHYGQGIDAAGSVSQHGAPRSMTMGTTRSPWRYDALSRYWTGCLSLANDWRVVGCHVRAPLTVGPASDVRGAGDAIYHSGFTDLFAIDCRQLGSRTPSRRPLPSGIHRPTQVGSPGPHSSGVRRPNTPTTGNTRRQNLVQPLIASMPGISFRQPAQPRPASNRNGGRIRNTRPD